MTFRFSRSMILLATLSVVSSGCAAYVPDELHSPDALTLYSIDGTNGDGIEPDVETEVGELFQGYPVLGKLVIEDSGDRAGIVSALNAGLANTDGHVAACFWPRHGIRVVQNGIAIDYVICFECRQLHIFSDGGMNPEAGDRTHRPVSPTPQPLFNEFLRNAGIPLAPGMDNSVD